MSEFTMRKMRECPFCPELTYPDLIVEKMPEGFGYFAWYKCPECDTAMLGVSDPDDEDPLRSALDMARERWNTRYEPGKEEGE